MPVKMHQVFYFVALCEEQSFSRAAKRCGVAQPSLTRAIQTLEEEFGAQLFERSRSNVRLTQLGLLVRPDFERISQATTVLAQRITEFKATSPAKPDPTSMETSMRTTIAIVAAVALILLGLALHPMPSATAGAPELARAPQMDPYAIQSIDGVSLDK
jgi:LysR family hydrogen peroxide-inducible transcriptional activator